MLFVLIANLYPNTKPLTYENKTQGCLYSSCWVLGLNFVNYNVVSQFQKVGHFRGRASRSQAYTAHGAALPNPVALCSPSHPFYSRLGYSCSSPSLSVGPKYNKALGIPLDPFTPGCVPADPAPKYTAPATRNQCGAAPAAGRCLV